MPVVRDICLELGIEDVLRREGIGNERNPRPQIMNLLKEILGEVKSSKLLAPSLAYEFYPINGFLTDRVKLKGGAQIQGTDVISKPIGNGKENEETGVDRSPRNDCYAGGEN